MAPTSSILPIQDAVAERRLYFGMLGLLLIVVDFLGRLKVERPLAGGGLHGGRAGLRGGYVRARRHLGRSRYACGRIRRGNRRANSGRTFNWDSRTTTQQQYGPAVEEFEKAGSLPAPDPGCAITCWWTGRLSLDGLNRPQEALAKLREAAQIDQTAHVYSQIGMIVGQTGAVGAGAGGPGRGAAARRQLCHDLRLPGKDRRTDRPACRRRGAVPAGALPGAGGRSGLRAGSPGNGTAAPAFARRRTMKPPLRIGINALYLIPGGVGGTEIYLRGLLGGAGGNRSLQPLLRVHQPRDGRRTWCPRRQFPRRRRSRFRRSSRPARILWEQTVLPLAAVRVRLDVLLNPGFTAPLFCPCPQVTVFHDLQHKRHPEYFRWFDLPFWRFFLLLVGARFAIPAGGFRRDRRGPAPVSIASRTGEIAGSAAGRGPGVLRTRATARPARTGRSRSC